MITAVIVDDEKKSIQTLALMLKEYCPSVEVIGEASSAMSAVKEILSKKPEVVFLDVEMPDGTGFDVLESIPERNFDVVFVTAYNHYALKAIKFHAADYILKPVDVSELKMAVQNVEQRKRENRRNPADLEKLLEHLKIQRPTKVAVPTNEGTVFINFKDIIRIQAERSYCILFLVGNRKLFLSKSLSEIEAMLDPSAFFRTHKSHLINLEHVQKHIKHDGGYVEMTDNSKVEISRRKKDEFVEAMNRFTGKS
jgi:two-component system, LytTR family, response regulator